jgi:hypothetical protein
MGATRFIRTDEFSAVGAEYGTSLWFHTDLSQLPVSVIIGISPVPFENGVRQMESRRRGIENACTGDLSVRRSHPEKADVSNVQTRQGFDRN